MYVVPVSLQHTLTKLLVILCSVQCTCLTVEGCVAPCKLTKVAPNHSWPYLQAAEHAVYLQGQREVVCWLDVLWRPATD